MLDKQKSLVYNNHTNLVLEYQKTEVHILDNSLVQKISWDLANYFRVDERAFYKSIAAAYLVVKMKEKKISGILNKSMRELCSCIENDDIRSFVYEMLGSVDEMLLLKLFEVDQEVLKIFILITDDKQSYKSVESTTPESIVKLAIKLLDIQDVDSVVDNCAGVGSFLASAYDVNPNADYNGVEISFDTACIASIKADVWGANMTIKIGNALDDHFNGKLFDKAFSNYPFGVRMRLLNDGSDLLEKIQKECPELAKGTSGDWTFNYRLCKMIKPKGRAIAVMSLGGLWNTIDKPIRAAFVQQRRIESIIKLPPRLFASIGIPVALVVFGNNTGTIRFIDASKLCVEGRRQNVLSDNHIEQIISAVTNDVDFARSVTIEEIAEQDYAFDPTRYLECTDEISNGVPFKSIILNITRGASCSASELDEMSSALPTKYQYVMLANVQNGIIDKELPYLKELPKRLEKYCIRKNNLLLSKNGFPFKVAVAETPDDRLVLANGNFYVIELDTEQVNPYYVKAYLESEQGIAQLKRITVGTSIPNIGVSQLYTIQIPLIPLAEQQEVALKYKSILDEIEFLRRKIEKAENSLRTVFSPEE